MSSVANNTTAPSTAPSAVEAAMPVSPSRVARQRSVESGSTHVPHHCEERTTAQQEPLPRQNSSDDLDGGYRSSCEGSVPEEGGCHCSHENHSHDSSSNCPMEEAKEAAALSAQALAAFAQEEQAEVEGGNLAPTPAHHLLENQTHNHTHTYHTHHRPMRSRPRSSVSTAAREEERQRLYAIPPLTDNATTGASASSSPAPHESAAGTSSARIDGKVSRTATTMTPVSLADASAADSDCSSTDAVCHNRNPLFASTNMKTSAAMLHVALDSEIRGAASTVSAATSASFPDVGPAAQGTEHVGAAVGGAGGIAEQSSSADLLLRVFPAFVTSRHESPARTRTLSAAEVGATPLQGTLSRLSRSSSNDSSAVEASIEAGAAAGATSTQAAAAAAASAASHRSASLPPHDGEHNGAGDATVVHNGFFNSSGASLCTPVTAQPAAGAASVVAASSNAGPAFAPVITVDAQTDNAGATSASASPAVESSRPQRCSTRTREKAKPASLTAPATPLVPHGASPSTASPVTHVGDVAAAACVHTSTNTVVTSTCSPLPSPSLAHKATPSPSSLRTPTVDISSSSSVGGHHLSVTEGNAFLKQSGSRREEAFYNMIRPYQETLVREAVRQAPHTVEHWRHQNNTASAAASGAGARRGEAKDGESGASPAPAGVSNTSIVASAAPAVVIRHVHADANSIGVSAVLKNGSAAATVAAAATTSAAHKDETMSLCEARWEAYQQYEAEDLSSLDILASAPLPTEEEQQNFSPLHRMRSESFAANSPVASPRSPDTAQPTSPLAQQVDKDLVELAARLWWTIRFQHFYRTSSSAYEVQRQAAEAASLSPPSPSAPSLAGGGRDGIVISRCSTPASQHRYPVSPSAATHGREDGVGTPPMPQMPAASPPSSMSVAAAAAAAASHLASLSGTATPTLMGSFAALSSDGVASNVSQPERQYSAQKHRALQLLAAFVPRYYGTLRLFLKDVLRCERRGVAATVAAAAAASEAAKATAGDKEEETGERHNPLTDSQAGKSGTSTNAAAAPQQDSVHGSPAAPATTASAMPVPKIVDADDDDDDDDDLNEAGGRKICRMIMLEYVCYRFRRPCVMDIKMGSRQYGLHPTAEKKRSKEQKSKLSTSGRYGIRLAGYRRWNAAESRYDFRGKLQCRALTLNEVKNEISAFLMNNRELERVYRRQLQRLRVAFSQQTVFRFYTSSLLFVYDAEDPLPTARVTMVDFAYTYESKELLQGGDPDADFAYDVGYLKAIDTLLSLLA